MLPKVHWSYLFICQHKLDQDTGYSSRRQRQKQNKAGQAIKPGTNKPPSLLSLSLQMSQIAMFGHLDKQRFTAWGILEIGSAWYIQALQALKTLLRLCNSLHQFPPFIRLHDATGQMMHGLWVYTSSFEFSTRLHPSMIQDDLIK